MIVSLVYIKKNTIEHYIGCLMGGAVGDVLGVSVEFESYYAITAKYGQNGITCYVENPDGTGEFTDDTHMRLFTAEGLLRAHHRKVMRCIGADIVEYVIICNKDTISFDYKIIREFVVITKSE